MAIFRINKRRVINGKKKGKRVAKERNKRTEKKGIERQKEGALKKTIVHFVAQGPPPPPCMSGREAKRSRKRGGKRGKQDRQEKVVEKKVTATITNRVKKRKTVGGGSKTRKEVERGKTTLDFKVHHKRKLRAGRGLALKKEGEKGGRKGPLGKEALAAEMGGYGWSQSPPKKSEKKSPRKDCHKKGRGGMGK